MNRHHFLRSRALGATYLTLPTRANVPANVAAAGTLPTWPLPDLKKALPDALLIRSVELLRTQGRLMLVVVAENGARGITQCNDRMPNLISLLRGLVLPHFLGKDARELPQLVDNAYRLNSNYKYAGMPPLELHRIGRDCGLGFAGASSQKPAYTLLGKPVRAEYPVYISDFYRGANPPRVW
jgi:hypothetical protein